MESVDASFIVFKITGYPRTGSRIKPFRGVNGRESRLGRQEERGRIIFSLNSSGGFAKRDQASVFDGVKVRKYLLGC
jgi:hypothetical protein